MDFSSLELYADDVVASSFENWPEELRRHALAEPLFSIVISPNDMRAVLSQNALYRRFLNTSLPDVLTLECLIDTVEGNCFPKIGPVSWKETSGFFCVPFAGVGELLPAMFRGVTNRMALVLHPFVYKQVSTRLHMFPFLDLSDSFEARFQIVDGEPVNATWMNRMDNSSPPAGSGKKLSLFAAEMADSAGIGNGLLDLVLIQGTDGEKIKVVEVNPIIDEANSRQLWV